MTSLLAANLSVTSVITQPFCRCEFFPTSRKNIPHQHYPQFSPSTPNTKKRSFLKISVLATSSASLSLSTPVAPYLEFPKTWAQSLSFRALRRSPVLQVTGNTRLLEAFTLGFLLSEGAQGRKKWGEKEARKRTQSTGHRSWPHADPFPSVFHQVPYTLGCLGSYRQQFSHLVQASNFTD